MGEQEQLPDEVDEPRRHVGFMVLLVVTALATAPFPFVWIESFDVVGIPAWLLWSATFTLLLACLTSWGVMRYWRGADDD